MLEKASEEYKGKGDVEGVLVGERVELCVSKSALDDAIKMLKAIKPDQSLYVQVR